MQDNDGGPASPWYASSTASSQDSLESIPEVEEEHLPADSRDIEAR